MNETEKQILKEKVENTKTKDTIVLPEKFDVELRVKISKRQSDQLNAWGSRKFMIHKMINEYPELLENIALCQEQQKIYLARIASLTVQSASFAKTILELREKYENG